VIEVAGPLISQRDPLTVTGTATLNGGFLVALTGFSTSTPVSFVVLQANSISGLVQLNSVVGYNPLMVNLYQSGNTVVLDILPVPEPGSLALIAASAGAALMRRRRRSV
jgi:hypothetical protein